MIVWSIDPGETVGLARWVDTGECIWKGSMSVEEYMQYLCLQTWDTPHTEFLAIVMEDYRLRQGKQMAQTGSRMLTSQVIGMTRLFARQHGTKVHLQDPQAYKLAAMHAGIKIPRGHIKDELSAYLHGYYFFESIGVLRPVERAVYSDK